MLKKAAPMLIALVFCAATAASAQERKDLQIFREISDQVNRYTQFTIFDNVET